jgi:hypothetical protein
MESFDSETFDINEILQTQSFISAMQIAIKDYEVEGSELVEKAVEIYFQIIDPENSIEFVLPNEIQTSNKQQ